MSDTRALSIHIAPRARRRHGGHSRTVASILARFIRGYVEVWRRVGGRLTPESPKGFGGDSSASWGTRRDDGDDAGRSAVRA